MKPGLPVPVTYRNAPDGDTFILSGLIPIAKGDPATGVNVGGEAAALIEKTEILLVPEFPTYKKLPAESIERIVGAVPATVRGVISFRAPELEIVNNEMSFSPAFAASKNFFDG
jgi:hypothetical protein